MKIGILTFHCAKNYGAVLQTLALCSKLKSMGYNDLYLIDYRPQLIANDNNKKVGARINKLIFDKFVKKYLPPLTQQYTNSSEIKKNPPDMDVYIVGSDQVWNPDFWQENDFTYLLDFAGDEKIKISYAASFGKEQIDFQKKDTEKIVELLGRFNDVSIREKSGRKILNDKFNISAKQVLDPTYLLDEQDYRKIFNLKPTTKKNSLLCFKFSKDKSFYKFLQKIKKEKQLDIKIIDRPRFYRGLHFCPYPAPRKWIKLFLEAEYILTDSFHGLAFSIIFKKKIIILPYQIKRFTRIKELLEFLKLTDRIFMNYNDILESNNWMQNINYEEVNKALNNLRYESSLFLESILL